MPTVDDEEIRALLTDGGISAITIDTSIFDQKRLHLSSATMQALANLKDRPFSFVLSSTVAKEVLAHLKKAAEDAFRSSRRGIGKTLFAFETEEPTRDDLLQQITGGRTAEEAAKQRWDKYINDTGCEVLVDTNFVDISTVFEGYFAGEPPFGSGRKKDEFPDALALHSLEHTAADRNIGIMVVSKDGDWRAFCERSEQLYLVPEIERALALVKNAPPLLRKAIHTWLVEAGDGFDELDQEIANSVEDLELTANAYATHGEVEILMWVGELLSIEWPEEKDIDIIDIQNVDGEGALQLVVSLPLELVVKVPIELEFSIWDSVDKESIDMGGRTVEVDEDISLRATVTVEVHGQGTDDEEFVFCESKLDDSYHEIELGEVDVFEPEDYSDIED